MHSYIGNGGARRFEQLNLEEVLFFAGFGPKRGRETPLLEVTRREAPFALPWADWDDPRLAGYLHDVLSTVKRLDMGGSCPLSEWFDLAQSQSQKDM